MTEVSESQYELVGVDTIKPHPANARQGNLESIRESIRVNGFYGACVVQRSTGYILAGNHRYMAAVAEGISSVPVLWVDKDDDEARRILLVDNRTNDLAVYDEQGLIDLLQAISEETDTLVGTGYTDDDLVDLIAILNTSLEDAKESLANSPIPGAGVLEHNVDAFFCIATPFLGKLAQLATALRPGVISSAATDNYIAKAEALSLDVGFIDNEFKEYNHAQHLKAVSILTPDYCTVRDAMTKTQCEEAGIDFYPLPQILEWAAELNEHAGRVMLIPKYDCFDDIPEEFMLGYSIPTSYGGTPLPAEAFKGRNTHLLGGRWDRQLRALGVLREDCVSMDNNHMMLIAKFGSCYVPGGEQVMAAEALPGFVGVYGYLLPLMLSMAAIVTDLHRIGCSVNGRTMQGLLQRLEAGEVAIEFDALDDALPEGDVIDRGDSDGPVTNPNTAGDQTDKEE